MSSFQKSQMSAKELRTTNTVHISKRGRALQDSQHIEDDKDFLGVRLRVCVRIVFENVTHGHD